MTTKRKRPGGPLLFVCATAKRGSGCRYREVRDEDVTRAFLKHRPAIFEERPRAGRGIKADQRRREMESAIDAIGDLLSGHQGLTAPASGQLRSDLETERAQLERAIHRMHHNREWFAKQWRHGPFELVARDVNRHLARHPSSVPKTNAQLTRVFDAVTLDYVSGELRLHWRNGLESSVIFAWPEERLE